MSSCNCPEYLCKVERRLSEEVERVAHYLDSSTEVKITWVVEKELIQNQVRLMRVPNSFWACLVCGDHEAAPCEYSEGSGCTPLRCHTDCSSSLQFRHSTQKHGVTYWRAVPSTDTTAVMICVGAPEEKSVTVPSLS